jgi:hypothetical protein
MNSMPSALSFLVLIFRGWVHRRQLIVIDYLKAENRMLCRAHEDIGVSNLGEC